MYHVVIFKYDIAVLSWPLFFVVVLLTLFFWTCFIKDTVIWGHRSRSSSGSDSDSCTQPTVMSLLLASRVGGVERGSWLQKPVFDWQLPKIAFVFCQQQHLSLGRRLQTVMCASNAHIKGYGDVLMSRFVCTMMIYHSFTPHAYINTFYCF